jgi:hypothetical protein
MNSGVDTISISMKQARDDINVYLDSIVKINKKIDSLVEDIRVRDVTMKLAVERESDKIRTAVEKIPVRPMVNYGFGGGYSYVSNDRAGEISISPILNVKRIFVIGNVGYGIDTKYMRYGVQTGLFFK